MAVHGTSAVMGASVGDRSSLEREVITRLVAPEHRGSEADIQATVRDVLLNEGLDLDDAQVRLESAGPGHRRVDVEVGATVVEVKKDLSRGVKAAREQLAQYLVDRQREHGDRYLGVLTDGLRWRAYRLPEPDRLVEVSAFDLARRDPDGDGLALQWDPTRTRRDSRRRSASGCRIANEGSPLPEPGCEE